MQMLLLPDDRPLVDRLGLSFFRDAPEAPGVYLMRDADDAVVYVGKAKNLKKRLGAYRVANPDRIRRRHLRLLRAVRRIELQPCADEAAAVTRESELVPGLRPRCNRSGTWPGKPKFLVWRMSSGGLELAIATEPHPDWFACGPMGMAAFGIRASLVRLLWCALYPDRGLTEMPAGWFRGRLPEIVTIPVSADRGCRDVCAYLEALF